MKNAFVGVWDWADGHDLLPGLQGVYVIPVDSAQGKSLIALRYDAGIGFGNRNSLGSLPAGQQIVHCVAGNWVRVRYRGPPAGLEAACLHLYGAWMWASVEGFSGAVLFNHKLSDPVRSALPAW